MKQNILNLERVAGLGIEKWNNILHVDKWPWEKKKEDGTALTTVERTAAFEQFIERMLTRHLQLEAAEATEWTKRVIKKNNAGTTINVKNVATKSPQITVQANGPQKITLSPPI